MAEVIFYEKPGCINNTLQKKMLREAGHMVVECNLLTTPWTSTMLRRFFDDLPVTEWFNPSAPAIKSGEVVPGQLSREAALTKMLLDPLLIRRPLMQVGDERRIGFDADAVHAWIGLSATEAQRQRDMEYCPKTHHDNPCAT